MLVFESLALYRSVLKMFNDSRLAKLGTVGQTFEDVIKSLLEEHDEKVKSKK